MADDLKIVPEAPVGKMEITDGEGMGASIERGAVVSENERASEQKASENKSEGYGEALKKVQTHQASDDKTQAHSVHMDAERVFHEADAETRIEHLVDIAMEKGPVYAVKVAKHLQDNYVLDMLHDRLLTDELHQMLVEKKLVDEE